MLDLAQVYNISDNCFVAILELLMSNCQRFLNQSRVCLYNILRDSTPLVSAG